MNANGNRDDGQNNISLKSVQELNAVSGFLWNLCNKKWVICANFRHWIMLKNIKNNNAREYTRQTLHDVPIHSEFVLKWYFSIIFGMLPKQEVCVLITGHAMSGRNEN